MSTCRIFEGVGLVGASAVVSSLASVATGGLLDVDSAGMQKIVNSVAASTISTILFIDYAKRNFPNMNIRKTTLALASFVLAEASALSLSFSQTISSSLHVTDKDYSDTSGLFLTGLFGVNCVVAAVAGATSVFATACELPGRVGALAARGNAAANHAEDPAEGDYVIFDASGMQVEGRPNPLRISVDPVEGQPHPRSVLNDNRSAQIEGLPSPRL